MIKFTLISILLLGSVHAVVIDKIAGVINEKAYTMSELKQLKKTIPARIEISPINYNKKKYNNAGLFELLKRTYVIKEHLNNAGYVINDDAVESRIKQTEQRLGLSRKDLKRFLKAKGITFDEYFEVIREAMEYTIFNQRIISPLITITDQEIKNYYYKTASNKKTLSFKYEVVDFMYSKKSFSKKDLKMLPSSLKQYQESGTIERKFKDFDTNNLGLVLGEDLPKDINRVLKKTDEGSFSYPIKKDGIYHVFYVKKKDLTESSEFSQLKAMLSNKLFLDKSKTVLSSWFNNEYQKHFIQTNL